MEGGDRLPDFVVIGTMKSGTTTLHTWLGRQPGCRLPAAKEPSFFSDDRAWSRGLSSYAAHFAGIPPTMITGEASVSYTMPDSSERAASRLLQTLPAARLVCVVRDPVARLRSHYRHERQRGRESRPFERAVTVDSVYARASCYDAVLAPWLDLAAPGQLLVVAFEDLVAPPHAAWHAVLGHVGLPDVDPPRDVMNRTDAKQRFTPVMRWLWDAGIRRAPRFAPRFARDLAKRLLLGDAVGEDPLAREALEAPVAPAVSSLLDDEVQRLEARLGRPLSSS